MEDKIEVGEYVRTINGIIFEFQKIDEDSYIWGSNYNGCYRTDIIKHSKNVIDLIEESDYVNGHLVRAVYLDGATKYIKLDNSYSIENNFAGTRTYAEDIRSIVTKEMMKQIEYRIE